MEIVKKPHPTGSLARRVILVCLALLVVPLFLHSILLYRIEYREKLADIQVTLRVIGQAQIALLQDRINLQWIRLDAFQSETGPVAKKLGIISIPLPRGASDHFVRVDPRLGGLVVGKELPNNRAIAIVTPFADLLHQLTYFQDAHYSLATGFIGPDGKIIAGRVEPKALSLVIPMENSNFSLKLTVSKASIQELHFHKYLIRFLELIFLIGVVGGFIVWLLTSRIAKPLEALCHVLDRVSEGAVHVRYESDRMGFEINELGKQFNTTLDSLLRHQKEAEQERVGREKLVQELKIGREIQMSLLPKHLPNWDELDIAPGFLPATEVSGDFYDLFPLEDGKLLIVIADTAGKGISACLYALGFRSLLRSFVSVKPELSDALVEANHLFWLDARESGMFITAWAGIYDRNNKLLTYASLGHPPAILKRGHHLHELGTNGIAFGATECDAIETEQIFLESKDLLVLCTDGILEAHNIKSELFGQKRMNDFILATRSDSSEEFVEELFERIQKFSGEAPQHDDITCLSIQIL